MPALQRNPPFLLSVLKSQVRLKLMLSEQYIWWQAEKQDHCLPSLTHCICSFPFSDPQKYFNYITRINKSLWVVTLDWWIHRQEWKMQQLKQKADTRGEVRFLRYKHVLMIDGSPPHPTLHSTSPTPKFKSGQF